MMVQLILQQILYYLFSLTIIVYIFIATIASTIEGRKRPKFASRRRIHIAILVLVVISYIAEASINAFQNDVFGKDQPRQVQLIVLSTAWSWVTLRPLDPVHILTGTSIISAIFEIPLLTLSFLGRLKSTLIVTSNVTRCTRLLLLVTIAVVGLRNTYATSPAIEDSVWETNFKAAFNLGS